LEKGMQTGFNNWNIAYLAVFTERRPVTVFTTVGNVFLKKKENKKGDTKHHQQQQQQQQQQN